MKDIKKKKDEHNKKVREEREGYRWLDDVSMFQDEMNAYIFNAGYDNDFYTD